MAAVSITDEGVQFGPLTHVRVHPAAELFPLLGGPEFADLVADIAENGLREPIVFTPDGQLLDGRNRYRACRKIRDEEPARRVEHSEPWSYVISTNMHRRHLSESQRAYIAAKIAERHHGQRGAAKKDLPVGHSSPAAVLPPTQQQAREMLNVSHGSLTRARRVLQHGTTALKHGVASGAVPVATADRVARQCTPEAQNEFARRVANGADPRRIAPPEPARPGSPEPQVAPREEPVSKSSNSKHRYVGVAALRHLLDAFETLDMVLKSADGGLDPAITNEQAARWMGDLSKSRGAYRRMTELLKQRKETDSDRHTP